MAKLGGSRNNLANSLNTLAVVLGTAGLRDDALAPIIDAVAIRRKLVESDSSPGAQTDLANSLNNLANRLGDLGRWEEAVSPA